MNFNEVNNAFNEVESVLRIAHSCAGRAIRFSAGRLRMMDLDADTLRALKRELEGFNATRGRWSSR